jgi:hypothetical protein
MLHLFMAALWLIAGAALLAWQAAHPEARGMTIWGSNVSLGWVALVLALYNLARWWSMRSATNRPVVEQEPLALRRRHETHEPPQAPDPTFNFTREEPRPGEPR